MLCPGRAHHHRCYAGGKEEWSQAKELEEANQTSLKELEPLKLPGDMAGYTGNVMYPNEESAVWDVDGKEKKRRRRESGGDKGARSLVMMWTLLLWMCYDVKRCQ